MFGKESVFPLLAFGIPLLLRAIPEVLMGPYVVGFDTMGHYVPTTLLWLKGGVDLWRYIATAPLFYTVAVSSVAAGVPIITALKIIPPVLHGLLGLSVYGFAKKGLSWSPKKSAFTAVLATAYFVALRVSWDMLRNELALVFFFVVLTLLGTGIGSRYSWRRLLLLFLAMIAVVLTHQLVTIIMFGMVLFTVVQKAFRKKLVEAAGLFAVALPPALLFFAILYFSPVVSEFRVIFGFPLSSDGWLQLFGFPSYAAMLASEAGFFLYCFLPILPFVVFGFWRFRNFQMRTWVLLILIASLVPMVSPSNLRWIMLLTYPFAFFVAEALSRLKDVSWRRFRLTACKASVAYLVSSTAFLSLGFMVSPPENPLFYFNSGQLNGYIYQIPSSMLQNTVSIADCGDTANALRWFESNVTEDGVLLAHRAFYGWALSSLSQDQVVLYEYNSPENTAKQLSKEGQSQIHLIWWVSGLGWYGQPTVADSFAEIYRSGRIAIYAYAPASVA